MATAALPLASSSGAKPHPPITILKRTRQDIPLAQNKFFKKTAKGKVLQCRLPQPRSLIQADSEYKKSCVKDMFEMIYLVDSKVVGYVKAFQVINLLYPVLGLGNIPSLQILLVTTS
jgi:hypothetical protein